MQRVILASLVQTASKVWLVSLVKMDDLELEENQERQAGGDPQALLVLLGQEEMEGRQEEQVPLVLKDLLAAKDHGEKLVNQVRTEPAVRQEKGVP